MKHFLGAFFALLLIIGFCGPAEAASDEWDFLAAVYVWAAGLDGDVTVAGQTAEVDEDFSDVLDILDGGIMLHFEASSGRWSAIGDLFFVDLGEDFARPEGEMDLEEWIVEGLGGYEVADDVDVLFGLRYVSLDGELRFSGPLGVTLGADRTWTDPIVGVRWTPRLREDWGLSLRGDIGGFGVDSDLTWQVRAMVTYDFTDHISVGAGFRALDYDFEEGEDLSRFAYDVTSAGAEIGVGFRF
jgi:hypothetical protein